MLSVFYRRVILLVQDFYQQDKELFILMGIWLVLLLPVFIKLCTR